MSRSNGYVVFGEIPGLWTRLGYLGRGVDRPGPTLDIDVWASCL